MITKLRVLTHLTPDKSEWGYLEFREGSPFVILDSGEEVSSTTPDVHFELEHQVVVDTTGESKIQQLKKRVRIPLEPILEAKYPYAPGLAQAEEPYYPPSSLGWYGRARYGTDDFYFLVQKRVNNRLWLTIVNEDGIIQESHAIKNHEYPLLTMKDDNFYLHDINRALLPKNPRKIREQILSILTSEPPTWEELLNLSKDVDIQGLNVGQNMDESLDTLIPIEYEHNIREEIKAFFAWLLSGAQIPDEDPLVYSHRIKVLPYYHSLTLAHIICIINKIDLPNYVHLIHKTLKNGSTWDRNIPDGISSGKIWGRPINRLVWLVWMHVLSRFDRPIQIVQNLNQSNAIITKLPVSYDQAIKTKSNFADRILMVSHIGRIRLTAHVRPKSIGMKYLIYIGRAHMYPHKHMMYSTIVGRGGKNPEHIQVMLIPHKAAEVIKRERPRVLEVEWSTWNGNFDMYDVSIGDWKISEARIASSFKYKKTVANLVKEFGGWPEVKTYTLNRNEAKILDILSTGINLGNLENKGYLDFIGLSNEELREGISNLRNAGVVTIHYEPNLVFYGILTSVAIVLQGPSGPVCSASRAFLKYSPTAQVFIGNSGTFSIIMSRLPQNQLSSLATKLFEVADIYDVIIRIMIPQRYTSFRNDLFQRLLIKEEELLKWDDDFTQFL